MKLLLGIPSAGRPAEPFLQSLQTLQLPSEISAVENKTVVGNFVPAQRELLAAYAIERDATYLLMADDDMVIPPDAVARLLQPFEDATVALVGALYYSRDGSRPMTVEGWDPADTTSAAIPAFDDRNPVEVDGVGFGLVMIRTSVFAELQAPFFPVQVYLERSAARVRICNEDYLFCRRLRAAHFRVLLHPGVRCGHYDRDSKITYPLSWEGPQETNQRRMMVRTADGTIGMIPFNEATSRTTENHQIAALDYIIVD